MKKKILKSKKKIVKKADGGVVKEKKPTKEDLEKARKMLDRQRMRNNAIEVDGDKVNRIARGKSNGKLG